MASSSPVPDKELAVQTNGTCFQRTVPAAQTCADSPQPLHARPSLRWSADERAGRVERGRAAAQSVPKSTMARPPGADDEYQELQKRFQILESERKNLFEHTQLEVKKNKEALGKLKKENKELRSNLSSLMCVPVPCAPARARSPATTPPTVGSPPAAAC